MLLLENVLRRKAQGLRRLRLLHLPFWIAFYFQHAFSFSCSFSLARLATSLVSVRLR